MTVRLVEAAPVAGALRFELLSEGSYKGAGRAAAADAREHASARERREPARGRERGRKRTTMSDG